MCSSDLGLSWRPIARTSSWHGSPGLPERPVGVHDAGMTRRLLAILAASPILLPMGCASMTETLPTETISFKTQVAPVFERSCSSCHAVGGRNSRDAVYLTASGQADYSFIKSGVGSAVREIANGSMPPRGETPVSRAEYLNIKAWMVQGSQNN